MFFLFIFCFSNCKEHILWVSNDGNDTYDGSYEYPLNSSNFANIRSKISQTSDDVDEASIIFKEGTYFSDGFAIMGWDYPKSRVRRLNIKGEDGKKVIIHGGEKIVNWTKSTIYKNLWTTFYPKQFDQLFVNEERAMPSRAPDKWSYSRLLGYEVFEDPEDPNYYLRYFIVQQDCTDLLQILTTEELQNVTLVVHHAWYCDRISILRIDVENHMIISRALKSEEIPSNQFGCIGVDNYYYLEGSHLF